jgi:type IV pilus assembly protein PilC
LQLFDYKAKNKSGKLIIGTVDAQNESAAAKLLIAKDLNPILIKTKNESSFSFIDRVSLKEKVQLIRQLATMINAGLPISQALATLNEQPLKKSVKNITSQAFSDVEGGATLSTAFSNFPKVFTSLDITLISSGETSGNLDKSLISLADQLEKQQSINRKIRGAFIYPAVVITIVIAVAIGMVIFVVPGMADLYESFDSELPLVTRILVSLSELLMSYGFIFLIALIAGIAYLQYLIRTPRGKRVWDTIKINTYGINILLTKLYMARFSKTLAGLIASGVALLDSLDITSRAIGNILYEERIKEAAKKVKSGVALSLTLKNDELFPPLVSQMIEVGEKTGEVDNMLNNMATYFEDEVDQAVKNLSTLLEPIIIVFLAVVIGLLLLAIMLPIYQVGQIV